MITIYHNPRCKKSREGLEYLKTKTSEITIRKYLTEPLSLEELKKLFIKLNVSPSECIRTQEKVYKEKFKGKTFNDEEWLKIIQEHPKLLQRPMVEAAYKAVLGNPPENVDELFE